MCDLTGRSLHQPVSQVIMHQKHEYKVDSVISVGPVSRPKLVNERRCSHVMKAITSGEFKAPFTYPASVCTNALLARCLYQDVVYKVQL